MLIERKIKHVFRNVIIKNIIHKGALGTHKKKQIFSQRENKSHLKDPQLSSFFFFLILKKM